MHQLQTFFQHALYPIISSFSLEAFCQLSIGNLSAIALIYPVYSLQYSAPGNSSFRVHPRKTIAVGGHFCMNEAMHFTYWAWLFLCAAKGNGTNAYNAFIIRHFCRIVIAIHIRECKGTLASSAFSTSYNTITQHSSAKETFCAVGTNGGQVHELLHRSGG